MNFGTSQEMIDYENEINPQSEKNKNFGCLVSIVFIILIIIILKYFS